MNTQEKSDFFGKTLSSLRKVWHRLATVGERSLEPSDPDLTDEDLVRLKEQMARCADTQADEISARAETATLGKIYLELSEIGRSKFLTALAEDFCIDRTRLNDAIEAWQADDQDLENKAGVSAIKNALEANRVRVLTRFNALPEGVKFLVDMRADLLRIKDQSAKLKAMNDELTELLASWFDIGFLKLKRITWDSPASLLEKLIAYEAVHEIQSWDDLKNRLDSDRRCYAFLHPNMPGEPLIFVEVALTIGLADNVQKLLDETAPIQDLETADTAIFYSISNAQRGLAGISFGNFLIKQVVAKLSQEFPGLKRFATLSPVVRFRPWLEDRLSEKELGEGADLLTASEQKAIAQIGGEGTGLKELLNQPNWSGGDQKSGVLQPILTRLAAIYLAEEKHRRGTALDPVAHFHLTNGAQLEQLNWMADVSEKGMRQSYGLMVNYLYQLNRIESNSRDYVERSEVNTSNSVKSLLK